MSLGKILRTVLEECCETEPHVSILQMKNGHRAAEVEGGILADHIARWWDCNVLVYRMDYTQNLLQVAVEGKPHDWGI